jgi:phosphoribosylamine---glycine ligase
VKILVLGSGGREHALAWKLSQSRVVTRVFVGPGNAGSCGIATNLPEVDPMDFETVESACRRNGIDCVFVGAEAPLDAGVVDYLKDAGIAALGPGLVPAQLESSKTFSKAFMARNGLPTARAHECSDADAFETFIKEAPEGRLVVKKSGLAAGKGVLESADRAELLAFGHSILENDTLLVEEFLEGWEVSIFGLSDGRDFIVLPPCTDFKKAHDGDTGPNTGGMGSICPVPWVSAELMRRIHEEILEPTYTALYRENLNYAGVLYFGLMVTAQGPKILEFNVRFGDPETQVLMPMLGFDLGELFTAMKDRTLGSSAITRVPTPGASLGVVVASRGYPEHAEKGAIVQPIPAQAPGEAIVFHASTSAASDGTVSVGGGRCFTAVGMGVDLGQASTRAYAAARVVRFDGGWFRGDIGKKFIDSARPGALE